MSCALSSGMELAASGGLDNVCSHSSKSPKLTSLTGSAAGGGSASPVPLQLNLRDILDSFLGSNFMREAVESLTASGDTTCVFWGHGHSSTASNIPWLAQCRCHGAIDLQPSNPSNCFISVSSDTTARYWDIRTGRTTRIFCWTRFRYQCGQLLPRWKRFCKPLQTMVRLQAI